MVIGIVAEYNPFHNGHKLQIDYAKNELHASHVVVAMSGSFTQRGDIACFDKYTRARAALTDAADVIFEIPTVFATSSAREFSSAAIRLLFNTGVVDTILFSAECDDKALFLSSATRLVELEKNGLLDEAISNLMSSGLSYALARAKTLQEHLPADLLSSPNNILGLEYCRYIIANDLKLDIQIMKRQGNSYDDLSLSGALSSASSIREHFRLHGQYEAVPAAAADIYNKSTFVQADDVSSALHYKLLTTADFSKYLDCTGDLSDRIKNNIKDFVSYSQFCNLIKTKNIEYSRISRVLCHILLDITTEDFESAKTNGYITYLRMLGFSKKGKSLLGKIKENGKNTILTNPDMEIVYPSDILSSEILNGIIATKTGKALPNEFTRKFDLAGI